MSDEYAPPWVEMTRQAPAGIPDDGPELLDKIRADLQMDDEWIVSTPRSLTWWGEAIPLTFSVAEPRLVSGDPTIKLTVCAAVLVDVPATTPDVLAALNEINHVASTGAFVWLERERRIVAFLTHYAYAGIEPITEAMTAFALLLYGEAMGRSRLLADTLGGSLNTVAHPQSGVRQDYDEMMTFPETQVLPAGEGSNRWRDGELEFLAGYLADNGFGISTGSADGLSVEFPLARNDVEKYVRLRSHFATGGDFGDDPIAPFFSMPTALAQLLCLSHPLYGNGLLRLLRFPVRTSADALSFANDFNIGEYRGLTAVPAVGAWCADDEGLVQTAFVPNYYRQDWVARNLAFWSGARTQWAFEALAPDVIAHGQIRGAP